MLKFENHSHNSRLLYAVSEMQAIARLPLVGRLLGKALETNAMNFFKNSDIPPGHNNLVYYLRLLNSDMENMINSIGELSRLPTADGTPMDRALADGTIRCRLQEDSWVLSACIEDTNEEIYRIHLSAGTIMALDDFFLRAFCNKDFFSVDPLNFNQRTWDGCNCFFSPQNNFSILPKLRFFDYVPQKPKDGTGGMRIDGGEENLSDWYFYYSNFFSGAPIEEASRLNSAAFASYIALAWIVLHEAAHYRCGHFHQHDTKANGGPLTNQMYRFDETENNPAIQDIRAKEFQADVLAAEHVVDLFFNTTHLKSLPYYAARDARWLARLIAVSIGMVMLIIEKIRQRYGIVGCYPSPITRLAATLWAINKRVMAHISNPSRVDASQNSSISQPLYTFEQHIVGGGMADLLNASEMLDESLEVSRATGDLVRTYNPGFFFPWAPAGPSNAKEAAITTHYDMPVIMALLDIHMGYLPSSSPSVLTCKTDFGRIWHEEVMQIIQEHWALKERTKSIRHDLRWKHINRGWTTILAW